MKINADTGVSITKKTTGGNHSADGGISKGKVKFTPQTDILQHAFSFKNAIEFRCITQAELDILEKFQEKDRRCDKICNYSFLKYNIVI